MCRSLLSLEKSMVFWEETALENQHLSISLQTAFLQAVRGIFHALPHQCLQSILIPVRAVSAALRSVHGQAGHGGWRDRRRRGRSQRPGGRSSGQGNKAWERGNSISRHPYSADISRKNASASSRWALGFPSDRMCQSMMT